VNDRQLSKQEWIARYSQRLRERGFPAKPSLLEYAATHAWERFGGHSKLESTVRYLGIEVDDALEISEQTDI
jgi:hypothetical protein